MIRPDRKLQIESIYHDACKLAPTDRPAFVIDACAGDDSLRSEVEFLLSTNEEESTFMGSPAQSKSPSFPGQTISHYRIVAPLGKGGMGEVYLARDIRLDRTVALKILPSDVANDPERMRRFISEAKAASALNHPHVATIYEIGEAAPEEGGVMFIAMEFVEGQTLAARINGRPLPVDEILEIGGQISEALEEAHGKGITHRDIKPANVMLTARGSVKVLDFGLAKVNQPSQSLESDANTLVKTASHVVMGTVPYMSPEQALGQRVDHRSDIFSLGIVLYEMATGRLPFVGVNTVEMLDRLLHEEPEAIKRHNDAIPDGLQQIVDRCLMKDREQRYQAASDLGEDLERLKVGREPRTLEVRPVRRTEPIIGNARVHLKIWAIGAVCVLLLAFGGLALFKRPWRVSESARPSVAVLPFRNLSGDKTQDWVSDGITSYLIAEFQKIGALSTRPITSVMQLKDTKKSLPEIAKELAVGMIIEGSAVREGSVVHLTVTLATASNGEVIWSQVKDYEMKDAWSLYSQVAKAVASEIKLELSPEDRASLNTAHPVSQEVQEQLWKGQSFLQEKWRDSTNIGKALASFQKATKLDPNSAEALAGVAESYGLLGNWGLMKQQDAFAKLHDAALRALELDDRNAHAHRAMIFWHFTWQHDWLQAEYEIKRTMELAPSDNTALGLYSEWMICMDRNDEAVTLAKQALEQAPNEIARKTELERIYYMARRYDDAIRLGKDIVDLDENQSSAAGIVSLGYLAKKDYGEAWRWRVKAVSANKRYSEEDRQQFLAAWGAGGWPAVWREDLNWLENRSGFSVAVKSGGKAAVLAQLGERDMAFSELETAFREHSSWLFQLSDARFDSLRSDPRFLDLRSRLNLPSGK